MSRDSVQITPTISALNDLDVLVYDIQNAYLMADCRERLWVVARPEFGSEAGNNTLKDLKLRDNKIEPPDVYLDAKLAKTKFESVKGTYTDQLG